MAAPLLSLAAIAMHDGSVMNLTALTGGSTGTGPELGWAIIAPLAGSTGAAWMIPAFNTTLYKINTNGVLVASFFGTFTGIGNGGSPSWDVSYQLDDEENNYSHGGLNEAAALQHIDSMNKWNFSGADCGAQWTLPADQKLRTLVYYMFTDGGNWQVEATLSDGSATVSPLLLGGSSGLFPNASFQLSWRAVTAGSTLTLKIRNPLNTVGTTSSIVTRVVYITPPTPAPIPRGARNLKTYLGLYGGSN